MGVSNVAHNDDDGADLEGSAKDGKLNEGHHES